MSRIVVDLNDDLLAEVGKILGTAAKEDTVNSALKEVLAIRRRAMALTRLRASAADGAIDTEFLSEKRNYRS